MYVSLFGRGGKVNTRCSMFQFSEVEIDNVEIRRGPKGLPRSAAASLPVACIDRFALVPLKYPLNPWTTVLCRPGITHKVWENMRNTTTMSMAAENSHLFMRVGLHTFFQHITHNLAGEER